MRRRISDVGCRISTSDVVFQTSDVAFQTSDVADVPFQMSEVAFQKTNVTHHCQREEPMTQFLPLLNSYVEKWAKESPDQVALLQQEDGKSVTYKHFVDLVDYFALALLNHGIQKGDRVATMLVLVPEHVLLMYACFKDRRHLRPPGCTPERGRSGARFE